MKNLLSVILEPTDRLLIAPGSNGLAESYCGCTFQEVVYNGQQWSNSVAAFMRDFPEVDVVRPLRVWGPIYDVMGCTLYKLTGRDLPANVEYQFLEKENMKADEYNEFIKEPLMFIVERFLPRVFAEVEKGSARSQIAYLKGGIAYMLNREYNKKKENFAEEVLGTPIAMKGSMLAPLDFIGNVFRGLKGLLMDLYRQTDKVLEPKQVNMIVKNVSAG